MQIIVVVEEKRHFKRWKIGQLGEIAREIKNDVISLVEKDTLVQIKNSSQFLFRVWLTCCVNHLIWKNDVIVVKGKL